MTRASAVNFTGESMQDLCSNGTDSGCHHNGGLGSDMDTTDDFLEQEISNGLLLWHVIFLATGAALSLVIVSCCCIKFRIPRTKQEIEADYIRKKILKKFRSRLKMIQNQDLDEMDMKRALDKICAEFKSDTESLALTEQRFSLGSASSSNPAAEKVLNSSTYRRASQIAMGISSEDLRAHMGVRGRMMHSLSRFCGRSKVGQTSLIPLTKVTGTTKPSPPPRSPVATTSATPASKMTA